VKIEQLIVQYLYLNKQVTLQGIGTFKLDPNVILPAGNEKDRDFNMPENAFQFDYNLKAGEDEGLVRYIVQHTNKILPLASSDLESYSMLAKQFLNIGKPLVIDGVGTVQKNQQGSYHFIPGVFITPRIDDIPKQVREKRDESVSFESEPRVNNSRRNLMIFLVVLVLGLAGLGAYYLLVVKKPAETSTIVQTELPRDTVRTDSMPAAAPDTPAALATVTTMPASDSFNIVLRNYPTAQTAGRALQRFSALGHRLLVLPSADSLNYELAMPFRRSLADTLKAKDSLRKFFGGNPYVKL
jgi:hypothetical protein